MIEDNNNTIKTIQEENTLLFDKARILFDKFDKYELLNKEMNKNINEEIINKYYKMKNEIIDLYNNLGRYCSKYCHQNDKFIISLREKIENIILELQNLLNSHFNSQYI